MQLPTRSLENVGEIHSKGEDPCECGEESESVVPFGGLRGRSVSERGEWCLRLCLCIVVEVVVQSREDQIRSRRKQRTMYTTGNEVFLYGGNDFLLKEVNRRS